LIPALILIPIYPFTPERRWIGQETRFSTAAQVLVSGMELHYVILYNNRLILYRFLDWKFQAWQGLHDEPANFL
jgi:hypothetical protein